MYTQCPECQTVFRLTEEQLALAGGKVRCGHCLGVFTAREHEVDAVPQPPEPRPAPRGQKAAAASTGRQGPVKTKPPQEGKTRPRPGPGTRRPDPGAPSPAKRPVSRAQMEREIERILSEEPAPGAEAGPRGRPPSAADRRTAAPKTPGAPTRNAEKPEPAARPGAPSPATRTSTAGAGTPDRKRPPERPAGTVRKSAPQEEVSARPLAPESRPGPQAGTASVGAGRKARPETPPEQTDRPGQPAGEAAARPGAPAAPEPGKPSAPDEAAAPSPTPADEPVQPENSAAGIQAAEDDALPAALRPPERTGSGPLAVVFWSLASLLMLAVLVAQYGYYERYELAKNATYRPWLERMCLYLDCRLPPRRNPAAFELQERDVRYHPEYAGALLISGTFINRAAFAQPYPTVEVLLRDVNGEVVAGRLFSPAEYLQDGTRAALLEPGTEAQLLLEVSDPGNQAVSFEFNFL